MDEEMQMPVEERVTSNWEPLKFETSSDYDYLRNAWYKRLGTALFRGLVAFILCFYNGLVLGVKVHGRENLRALKGTGAVAVCNHVHDMDCTIHNIALLPRRVYHVSLDSNFRIPVVRHIIRWLGAVPLSRSPKQVRRLFSEMETALRAGAIVQVYPEGVLVPYDRQMREFHNGGFRMAAEANVPVLPMMLLQRQPRCVLRLWKRKPCMELYILPPIFPEDGLPRPEAVARYRREARAAMEQAADKYQNAKNLEKTP